MLNYQRVYPNIQWLIIIFLHHRFFHVVSQFLHPPRPPIFFQILPLKSQHFGPQIRRPSPWRPTSVPRSRAHPDLALDGQMAWDRPADYQRGSTRSSVVRPANFPSSAAWVLSVSVVVGERNSSESDKMPRPGKIFGTWNSAMGP